MNIPKLLLLLIAGFIVTSSILEAEVEDAVLGQYNGASSATSNQQYRVTASLSRVDADIRVDVAVAWQPGVSCEIELTIPAENVTKTLVSDGSAKYSMVGEFLDSHGNTGIMTLEINNRICELDLVARRTVESAAARQYGKYTLQKQPSS